MTPDDGAAARLLDMADDAASPTRFEVLPPLSDEKFAAKADLEPRDVLMQEVAAFGPCMTATGGTAFEGHDGAHDDPVLALSIGVWHQSQPRPQPARWLDIS